MRKIIAICASALLTLAFAPESGAQNMLGRLADRAKNAAENALGKKIENAVNNAVEKAMGGKTDSNDQQSPSQAQPQQPSPARDRVSYGGSYSSSGEIAEANREDYDPIKEFVDDLADIKYRQEENRINSLDAEDDVQNLKVNTVTDVIKLLPEFPTADQIINLDQAFNLSLQKFSAAAATISSEYIMVNANVIANEKYTKGTASASKRTQMDAGAMQIFVAMQKYGIDPEKATDKEMEEFMKKAVANGDIQVQNGKGQAFDMNYTDLQENEIDKISDRISALSDAAEALVAENAFYSGSSPFQKSLDSLYNESVSSWKTSDAYKKIYDIEKDIDKRAWDYFSKHPDANNNGATIPYPPFWEQGRKQENAIIREYNMSYIGQWAKKLKANLEKPIALFKEIEEINADLEKTFPDKTDLVYANLKSQLGTSITHIKTTICYLLGLAYSAPVINSVAERKVLSM